MAGFRSFDRVVNEVITVNVASYSNPGDALTPYGPVELINFEVGVMEKTRKNKDTGATEQIGINVWYRCDEVRSTAAISGGRKLHSAEGA